jgi:hypothetical protein
MNSWSETLSGGHTNANSALQASWAVQEWTKAAEIIRHTSNLWTNKKIEEFQRMLKNQYLTVFRTI